MREHLSDDYQPSDGAWDIADQTFPRPIARDVDEAIARAFWRGVCTADANACDHLATLACLVDGNTNANALQWKMLAANLRRWAGEP